MNYPVVRVGVERFFQAGDDSRRVQFSYANVRIVAIFHSKSSTYCSKLYSTISTVQEMAIEKVDREPDNRDPARSDKYIEYPRQLRMPENSTEIFLTLSQDGLWAQTHRTIKIKNTLSI